MLARIVTIKADALLFLAGTFKILSEQDLTVFFLLESCIARLSNKQDFRETFT